MTRSQDSDPELTAIGTEPVSLRAGSLELLFEANSGWLRRVQLGTRELVRAIFGAVRDQDWRTVPAVLRDVSLKQRGNEGFEITFLAECRSGEIHFVWNGLISGDARGEVRFEFDGVSHSDFLRNRIGLCLLLPIAECAGQACQVEHSDGTREETVLPTLISPHQPVQDIRGLRLGVTQADTLEVQFSGDVFEMEDQRNWTDASFKVYSTPLSLPFPVQVTKGDRVRQSVTLKLIAADTAQSRISRGTDVSGAAIEPARVEVNFDHLRRKPPIGLGWGGEGQPVYISTIRRLQTLNLNHLRVDCRLWESDWKRLLPLADQQATALGARLHIALFLSENAEAELRELHEVARRLLAPVTLWLVFEAGRKCNSPDWVMLARDILGPASPGGRFAAGTDAYFAELNRDRPSPDADWLPCCSINPQVHASDTLSLVENLAAQTDVVRTAREFSRHPLVISPVTLLPRSNPDATSGTSSRKEPAADPRQASLFAAGWTLGSVAALTASHPVHSLTYYESVGPRGILPSLLPVFPVFHVFAALGDFTQLAEARCVGGSAALQVAALAGITSAGRPVVWLANLTSKPLKVCLQSNPEFRTALMRQINEQNLTEATQNPEPWLRTPDTCLPLDPGVNMELPRYGLARLELEQ